MTPAEYIESGVLELYVLGAASPAEAGEVERMILLYPEIAGELDRIRTGLEKFADLHRVEPNPAIRDKILQAATGKTFSANGAKVIALEKPRNDFRVLAIAASLLLLISVGVNFFLYTEVEDSKGNIAALEKEKSNAESSAVRWAQYTAISDSLRAITEQSLQFIRNPMTKPVALNSIVDGHPMKAMVYWDTQQKMVAVDPMTLPRTDSTQQYELWAIVAGKPVAAGLFTVTGDSMEILMMNAVPEAEAFAISLEKMGGSSKQDAPEGPVYVMGKP
jgi:anti-sigma-K factor RskA